MAVIVLAILIGSVGLASLTDALLSPEVEETPVARKQTLTMNLGSRRPR